MAQAQKSPGFAKNADYYVRLETTARRLRVKLNGEFIADTRCGMMMFEAHHLPVYYFPLEDVRLDLMSRTDHHTNCPFKGDASYWTATVGDRTAENVLWSYETPYVEVPDLKDLGAFYWDRVDHWYEEDEEIFVHPRDPYKRIDVIPSSRPVRVVVGGQTVAETTGAHFLFETNLPVRYYIPGDDVRMDLLAPTDTHTRCPYKGIASYWSATIDGAVHEDVVWSYPDPIPECPKVKDLMCFYNENVDAIEVDGIVVEKPKTKWSRS